MVLISTSFHNFPQNKFFSKKFFNEEIKKNILLLDKNNKKISLAIVFLSRNKMRQLNSYWRKKDKATTVLSFVDSGSEDNLISEKILGDLFLCPEEIYDFSKERKESLKEAYQKIIQHGILNFYQK